MERHAFSTQAFLPVDVARYLVMVAPDGADGGPDLAGARLFLVDGRTGINYRAGVWHPPMTVLDRDAVFATVMFNDGSDRDEDWPALPVEVELTITCPRAPATRPRPVLRHRAGGGGRKSGG